MYRYGRVICPECSLVSEFHEPGEIRGGCEHFERVMETEEGKVAVFFHHYGEEVPVILDSVADQCAVIECPICGEEVNACIHGKAKQYVVRSRCSQFRSIRRDGAKICIRFQSEDREESICL